MQIDADLRSVFNWNVKQLFVYITAEYETEANVLNQVVVWDTIVNDVSQARRRHTQAACARRGVERAKAFVALPVL